MIPYLVAPFFATSVVTSQLPYASTVFRMVDIVALKFWTPKRARACAAVCAKGWQGWGRHGRGAGARGAAGACKAWQAATTPAQEAEGAQPALVPEEEEALALVLVPITGTVMYAGFGAGCVPTAEAKTEP